MAEIEIRSAKGEVVGKHTIGGVLAEVQLNHPSVHRAVVAEQAAARQGTQSAKTRSEVRGGGRKPYRQKKTGNARQGSIRAPHYKHGGMAFAVKPRSYEKKVNKKERRLAVLGLLSQRIEAGDFLLTDTISFAAPKTKDAVAWLAALGVGAETRVLVILPEYDEVTLKSFRNLPNVVVRTAPSKEGKSSAFSARDLLLARKVVAAKAAMERIEEVWA